MESEIIELKEEVQKLKARNARVEAEKAWEVSSVRIATIAILIYIVSCVVFYLLGTRNFFLGALVPPVGYIFSMQSVPFMKQWWMKRYESRRTLQ